MRGLTKEIRRILRQARTSLGAGKILAQLPEYEGSKNDLQANLHSMIKTGNLMIDGRGICETCGTPHQYYRLTDKGKAAD